MKHDIAFVHTSSVHVPTFERLMQEVAPGLRAAHFVHEALLADAQRVGASDPPLAGRIREAMRKARASGAPVVMCTCSTIGGIAETMDTAGAFITARIDRAMADEAVRNGGPGLLCAAPESTLGPTRELLRASAESLGTDPVIESLVVTEAWPHFMSGDQAAYIEGIVAAVSNADAAGCVIVLAQASMAPAAGALAALGILALSSPRLGVERAVALHAGKR